MLSLLKTPSALGLEKGSTIIKKAEVFQERGRIHLSHLEMFSLTDKDSPVKRLYKESATLITAIEGSDLLVRSLFLPLKKDSDIDAALAFQAEPLLPYSIDEALLAWTKTHQVDEGTWITLVSARKDFLQKHLDDWHAFKVEPEIVACTQTALWHFGQFYTGSQEPFLALAMGEQDITGVLIKESSLQTSYSQREGLSSLLKAASAENISLDQVDWSTLASQSTPLAAAWNKLQLGITRLVYALSKDLKGEHLQGMIITGEGAAWPGFLEALSQKLNLALLPPSAALNTSYSSSDLLRYALPIGLGIAASTTKGQQINFRQQGFAYPHPWKRVKTPLALYFVLCLLLTVTFYFFGQAYLGHKESRLKEQYIDLLTAMNKSHESFEAAFLAKNPAVSEKFNGEVVNVIELSRDDLLQRLEFLQKDLQAIPDSFPLYANIPRVSDVLAWLSTHPYVVNTAPEEGETQPRLQIENFSYSMLKRPVQGKKQEKYQVKVELEFSSPTPKWAREFHDALIASNDFVDPKGEVKWSSNRGRYRTSFYLKDKTLYPGQ